MNGRTPLARFAALSLLVAVAACSNDSATDSAMSPDFAQASAESETAAQFDALMDDMYLLLADSDLGYQIMSAEYIAADEMGATVLQRNVGNKQLTADFVPGDARRSWSSNGGNGITYAIDHGDGTPVFGGVSEADASAALQRAMGTWAGAQCSELSMSENPDFGLDIGLIAFFNGLGGSPFVFGDVQHAGFDEIDFSGGVIGATFTFIFTSGGVPTDIDGNGMADVAFREIYYDPSFNWADDGSSNIDIETVALHEAGHGLSQGHFGNLFLKNGALSASPRAIMNAFYGGPQRSLLGTDNAGHCSNWANWPNG